MSPHTYLGLIIRPRDGITPARGGKMNMGDSLLINGMAPLQTSSDRISARSVLHASSLVTYVYSEGGTTILTFANAAYGTL